PTLEKLHRADDARQSPCSQAARTTDGENVHRRDTATLRSSRLTELASSRDRVCLCCDHRARYPTRARSRRLETTTQRKADRSHTVRACRLHQPDRGDCEPDPPDQRRAAAPPCSVPHSLPDRIRAPRRTEAQTNVTAPGSCATGSRGRWR